MDDRRLLKIGEVAKILGTVPATMRAWERSGELLPARRTRKGTRYYAVSDLLGFRSDAAATVGYARVSSHDQKADLDRQHAVLEAYCAAKGWQCTVVRDLGSGLNYRKKGLQRVLEMILRRQMKRLVLTHKDRLMRFGSELVFGLCELQGVEVVIINAGEQTELRRRACERCTGDNHGVQCAAVWRTLSQVQEAARRPDGCGSQRRGEGIERGMMLRTHLIALDPNDKQASALAQHAGYARVAWNHALADFKAGLDAGEFRNDRKLRPRFNEVKATAYSWSSELSQNAAKNAIINLGRAIDAWQGKTQGAAKRKRKNRFPRFKKKGRHDSFRADNGRGTVKVRGAAIPVAKDRLVADARGVAVLRRPGERHRVAQGGTLVRGGDSGNRRRSADDARRRDHRRGCRLREAGSLFGRNRVSESEAVGACAWTIGETATAPGAGAGKVRSAIIFSRSVSRNCTSGFAT